MANQYATIHLENLIMSGTDNPTFPVSYATDSQSSTFALTNTAIGSHIQGDFVGGSYRVEKITFRIPSNNELSWIQQATVTVSSTACSAIVQNTDSDATSDQYQATCNLVGSNVRIEMITANSYLEISDLKVLGYFSFELFKPLYTCNA